MNILFLRGSIPPKKEHPEKLYYDTIENCEDMWTQLFYFLTKNFNAKAELLYQGGKRNFQVSDFFVEKWVKSFKTYSPGNNPDLIVCRGGFPFYDDILKRYPKAKKVYYGAGVRFYPKSDFDKYDLFLVDSKSQLKKIKNKHKKNAHLFIKPAALLFKPYNEEKIYDVCFMGNASHAHIKRHKLLIKSFANTPYKILNLGNKSKEFIKFAKKMNVNIEWGGWDLRKNLPQKISQCKISICCSTN